VGPRTGLDVIAKAKVPSPRRESNSDRRDRPARSLVAIGNELSRLTLLIDWLDNFWVSLSLRQMGSQVSRY